MSCFKLFLTKPVFKYVSYFKRYSFFQYPENWHFFAASAMDSSTTVNHNHLSDLENTKESILPVCDKPYHKIKENMPLGEELENLWNFPFKMEPSSCKS